MDARNQPGHHRRAEFPGFGSRPRLPGGLAGAGGGGTLPEGTGGRAAGLGAGGDPGLSSRVWLPIPPETVGGRTSAGRVAWGGDVGRSAVCGPGAAGSSTRGSPPPGSDGGRSAGNAGGSGSRSTVLSAGWGAGATATRSCSAGARHGAKLTGGNPSDPSRMAADTPAIVPHSQRERDTSHASPRSELPTFPPMRFTSFNKPSRMAPDTPAIVPHSRRERDTSHASPRSELPTFPPMRFTSFNKPPGTRPGSLARRPGMEPRTTHGEATGYDSQGNSGDGGRSECRWEYLRQPRESPKGTRLRDHRRSDPRGPTRRRRTDSDVYEELGSGGHLSPNRPRSPPRTAHRCTDPGPAARNLLRWDHCAASGAPSSSGERAPRFRALPTVSTLVCSWRWGITERALAAGDSFGLLDTKATCVHLRSGVPSKGRTSEPNRRSSPILPRGHL